MKVLITGSGGFIAQNLKVHLQERKDVQIFEFNRQSSLNDLNVYLKESDFIFHLAGANRPVDETEFIRDNSDLTFNITEVLLKSNQKTPVLYTSSIQAESDNPYGKSKKMAENALLEYGKKTGAPVFIYRLPNVFGKWSRPNYNSVVATFCYNISRGLPVKINDPKANIKLVYIDDVILSFLEKLALKTNDSAYNEISTVYNISVGELEKVLQSFKGSRKSLVTEKVGTGLMRALHSTYLSYLPPAEFSYQIPIHGDQRGVFVEMLKTIDSGQFSFFTAHPGITRGEHYHHSKTEKFLLIKGKARFRFRHIISNEKYEIITEGSVPNIVETIPGWAHDITNIGQEEMIVMLWANEIFDREKPDTYSQKVEL